MTAPKCALYVLNVPEFAALVAGLQRVPGLAVETRGDYCVAQAEGDIAIDRRDVGVGEAVWFGALTGGIAGRIVEFSEATLRLAPSVGRDQAL